MPAITELAQLDATGREQLRVSRLAMDVVGSQADFSKEPKFAEAVAKKVYYGPVYFRRESEPYMTLALAGTRRDAGVSVAEVNLKLIWDVVSQIKVGEHGQAYVVDAQGRLIAHPDISLVLRNTDMTRLAQVQGRARGRPPARREQVQEAEDIRGRKVLTAYAPVAPLGWLVFVELPADEAYAPLYDSIKRSGVLLLARPGAGVPRRPVPGAPHGGADPGVARRRRAHRQRRPRPAHLDQDRRRARRRSPTSSTTWPASCRNPTPTSSRRSSCAPRELAQSVGELRALGEVSQAVNSTLDLETVLDTIVAKAVQLSGTDAGAIYVFDEASGEFQPARDLRHERRT